MSEENNVANNSTDPLKEILASDFMIGDLTYVVGDCNKGKQALIEHIQVQLDEQQKAKVHDFLFEVMKTEGIHYIKRGRLLKLMHDVDNSFGVHFRILGRKSIFVNENHIDEIAKEYGVNQLELFNVTLAHELCHALLDNKVKEVGRGMEEIVCLIFSAELMKEFGIQVGALVNNMINQCINRELKEQAKEFETLGKNIVTRKAYEYSDKLIKAIIN